jgi:hypothetical protein
MTKFKVGDKVEVIRPYLIFSETKSGLLFPPKMNRFVGKQFIITRAYKSIGNERYKLNEISDWTFDDYCLKNCPINWKEVITNEI